MFFQTDTCCANNIYLRLSNCAESSGFGFEETAVSVRHGKIHLPKATGLVLCHRKYIFGYLGQQISRQEDLAASQLGVFSPPELDLQPLRQRLTGTVQFVRLASSCNN